MAKRSKISFRIALIVGVVEILAMAALFLIMNQTLTRILEKNAISDLNVIAKDRAQIIETYISGCVDFLDCYSKASEIRDVLLQPEDPEAIEASRAYTNHVADGHKDIEGLYVAKFDTYVLAHINPDSVDKTFREPGSAKELEDTIRKEGKAFCTGIVMAPVSKR
ncbi:MAG: hypothetical protein IK088_09190, partial [Lachnospiraceae bacterium]|nr:hypothetical protein [Lachnospiraceae bacterium]